MRIGQGHARKQQRQLLTMVHGPRAEVLYGLRAFLQHFPGDHDTMDEYIWPLHDVLYKHHIPPVFHWMA